jgi:hypothetical protein
VRQLAMKEALPPWATKARQSRRRANPRSFLDVYVKDIIFRR